MGKRHCILLSLFHISNFISLGQYRIAVDLGLFVFFFDSTATKQSVIFSVRRWWRIKNIHKRMKEMKNWWLSQENDNVKKMKQCDTIYHVKIMTNVHELKKVRVWNSDTTHLFPFEMSTSLCTQQFIAFSWIFLFCECIEHSSQTSVAFDIIDLNFPIPNTFGPAALVKVHIIWNNEFSFEFIFSFDSFRCMVTTMVIANWMISLRLWESSHWLHL